MILFIDNYDSFTYILVDVFGQLTSDLQVVRNDKIQLTDIEKMQPQGIVISPGPGTPDDAGISCAVIEKYHRCIPILGVCLGHQCIGQVFGAEIIRGPQPVHGKTSAIYHNQGGIFEGIPSPFEATRYHSLIIKRNTNPAILEITAETGDRIIMAIQHREFPLTGVQFHPESILTSPGKKLIQNWIKQSQIHYKNYYSRLEHEKLNC
jgi:anthranilate synthase/aminodeoxychorismate synthase-like glutamine amidotransferase